MTDQIPFTTGSLRDWPLFRELVDEHLSNIVSVKNLDDEFRDEVKKNVRGLFEALNEQIAVSSRTHKKLQPWFSKLVSAALLEGIRTAFALAVLRRQVKALGGEPFRLS
jgi:hypothetical protein